MLTKRYFKKFQYILLAVCVLSATVIGSIQTALIIYKGKGNR